MLLDSRSRDCPHHSTDYNSFANFVVMSADYRTNHSACKCTLLGGSICFVFRNGNSDCTGRCDFTELARIEITFSYGPEMASIAVIGKLLIALASRRIDVKVLGACSGTEQENHGGKNVLMDVPDKYAGFTHIAFNVEPIEAVISALGANNITITQGPVSFGLDGHVSVFVRDPDLNVIEFRGRSEDLSTLEGLTAYEPKN